MDEEEEKEKREEEEEKEEEGWVDEPLLTSDFGFATGCTCTH
jgi:hypothetical protein